MLVELLSWALIKIKSWVLVNCKGTWHFFSDFFPLLKRLVWNQSRHHRSYLLCPFGFASTMQNMASGVFIWLLVWFMPFKSSKVKENVGTGVKPKRVKIHYLNINITNLKESKYINNLNIYITLWPNTVSDFILQNSNAKSSADEQSCQPGRHKAALLRRTGRAKRTERLLHSRRLSSAEG